LTPTIIYTEELITRCRKGEQRAQLEIYEKYSKAMYNTAFRIIKDTAEAEDVMQEAFIKAFSKLDSFKGQSTFGAWLKRIVINLSINTYNRRKKYDEVAYKDEMKNETFHEQYELLEEERNNAKVKIIMNALNHLKENYRIILSLHFIEGYDYDEICEILQISSANCRTTISRAKDQLRKKLVEYEA
jgi:RNA polymerase sigma factor (sigma-70 family)